MQTSAAGTSPEKVKKSQDAEIAAMSKIGRILEELPWERSRHRVLTYLHSRHCKALEFEAEKGHEFTQAS